MRTTSLIDAYRRTRWLRNVMLVAFGAFMVATLLWVLPWVPWGLTMADYNAGDATGVGLAFATWMAGLGVVYLRDQSNRYEQSLISRTSIQDQLGDVLRHDYFHERAVIECMRSQRTGISFGVFAVRFNVSESVSSAETAAALEALAGLIRQTDSLAALALQEVGVLGSGVGNREAPAFAYRLKSTVEAATGARHSDQVSVGWAIWGVDGSSAEELVSLARSRTQRKSALREWARGVDGELDEGEGGGPDATDGNAHLRVVQPLSQVAKPSRDETVA